MDFEIVEPEHLGTNIKVVGVGGAGGNACRHMIESGMTGVGFICINSDAQALAASGADLTLQIGAEGLGAGMNPQRGREMAEADRDRIESALRGAHMVFITAGMGGGTGTGAAPVVAKIAQEMGILTVAVVTKPFSYEGKKCLDAAEKGLENLAEYADSIIVVLNEKLEEVFEDASFDEWFKEADGVLYRAVSGIVEIINSTGYMNVDFNDVKTIMGEKGKAMMGTASATGIDRARIAAEQASASPLLDGMDLTGARGLLLNISASKAGLKGKEIKEIVSVVSQFASPEVNFAHGVVYDESLDDAIRVTIIATGLGRQKRQFQILQNEARKTGTDDAIAEVMDNEQPTVFRSNNANEAIRRLEQNGMDRLDIPAYLRKQAD